MSEKDWERVRSIPNVRALFFEKYPIRIAIAALLNFGYTHEEAATMMAKSPYYLWEREYRKKVRTYNLRDISGFKPSVHTSLSNYK